jgi:hypothetical protein
MRFKTPSTEIMLRVLAVLLVTALVGCGTMRFDRSEPFSNQDLQRDFHECEDRSVGYMYIQRGSIITRCMNDKGWTRTD